MDPTSGSSRVPSFPAATTKSLIPPVPLLDKTGLPARLPSASSGWAFAPHLRERSILRDARHVGIAADALHRPLARSPGKPVRS